MKKTLALLLSLVMVFALCVTAFADDAAPVDSEFAVLNQGTSFFASKDATEPAGFLAQNHFVKVVEVDGDMANIVWENTCRFNGVINGDAWVSASALDMITEEDLPKYCLPYPDLDKWLGREKTEGSSGPWALYPRFTYGIGHLFMGEAKLNGLDYYVYQIIGDEQDPGYFTYYYGNNNPERTYRYTGSGTPTEDKVGNIWSVEEGDGME